MNAAASPFHKSSRFFYLKARLALMVIGLTVCFVATDAFSQRPAAVQRSANRFLFIIDTSSAMAAHLADIDKAVGDILDSDMTGQLHAGDTIGVWTYNSDVHDDFPMQIWDRSARGRITLQMISFLDGQKFRNRSKFGKILPDLNALVKNSDILTVFIISNGEIKMAGTPFDSDFNAQYKINLKESDGEHLPVVSVLQSKSGRLFRFTSNPIPWPVVIPELPIPIRAIEPEVKTPPVVAPIAAAKVVSPTNAMQPLVYVGPNASNSNVAPRLFPKETGAPTVGNLTVPPPPNFKPPPPNTNGFVIPTAPPAGIQPMTTTPALPTMPVIPAMPGTIPALPLATTSNLSTGVSNAEPPRIRSSNASSMTFEERTQQTRIKIAQREQEEKLAASNKAFADRIAASNAYYKVASNINPGALPKVKAETKSLKERALAFIAPADGSRPKSLLVMAGILVLIALLLIVVMVRRSRANDASLISRSMKK